MNPCRHSLTAAAKREGGTSQSMHAMGVRQPAAAAPFASCSVRATRRRSGVAAAELAVCLPVLLLFVVGAVECCTMMYVDQTLAVASYEGVRVAIRFDGTNAEVEEQCEAILTARRVVGATIAIDPPNVADVPRGEQISISVSAPCRENCILTSWFFGEKTLTETSNMIKE